MAMGLKHFVPSSLVRRRLPSGNGVLLTFDDGPDSVVTPAVLDRLQAVGARAIFFVVGQRAERYPDLIRRIHSEGHLVGNHTYSHLRPHMLRLANYRSDIARCQDAIAQSINITPRLFRPPYGHLTPVSLLAPRMLGLRIVKWSLDVMDWKCQDAIDAERASDELLARVAERDIVLLHDNHPGVLTILDRALRVLFGRGFDLAGGTSELMRRAP